MPNLTNSTNPTKRRLATIENVAALCDVVPLTPENWVNKGWVHAFVDPSGQVYLDLDEIAAAKRTHPRMKIGPRSRFSKSAQIEPLREPVEAITEAVEL